MNSTSSVADLLTMPLATRRVPCTTFKMFLQTQEWGEKKAKGVNFSGEGNYAIPLLFALRFRTTEVQTAAAANTRKLLGSGTL